MVEWLSKLEKQGDFLLRAIEGADFRGKEATATDNLSKPTRNEMKRSSAYRSEETKTETPCTSRIGKEAFLEMKENEILNLAFYTLLDLNPWRREQVDEATFLILIEKDASLCKRKYHFGSFPDDRFYPLHMICALGASADCVKACYKKFPEALKQDDTSLGNAAHFACTFNAKVDVVKYLAKKDADMLQKANKSLQTPLHLAIENQADSELIIFLTARVPAAAKKIDCNGMTPLNLACRADVPRLEVVEDLTSVYPEAGVMCANNGSTPLLNAIRRKADSAILKDLIISNPKSAAMTMKLATPLHKALEKNVDLAILKQLIRAFPEALKRKDSKGRIPLHVYLAHNPTLDVCQLLVNKCPETVEIQNADGEIPHEQAKRMGASNDIVQFLDPYEEVSETETMDA